MLSTHGVSKPGHELCGVSSILTPVLRVQRSHSAIRHVEDARRGPGGDLCSNPAYLPHDLSSGQILDADELRFTRDPFDALICAAARDLGAPLLTRDAAIRGSGTVRVLW